MTSPRIVIVSFTRLGDLIQSVPLLRNLRDRHPHATLTLVANAAFADAARRLPCISNVIPFELDSLVPRLDAQRGDLASAAQVLKELLDHDDLRTVDEVYNLSHTKLSATLCTLLNARRVHGYVRNQYGELEIHGKWFAYLFSILEDRTYNPYNLVEIYSRFAVTEGIPHNLGFNITEADRYSADQLLSRKGIQRQTLLLALQPGASTTNRQWPVARFGELALAMNKRGWSVIVLGSETEKTLTEAVVSHSGGTALSLAGQTSVGSLAAVLARATWLVSNDTGTIHIAAAVGTPCVGIYLGPASAKDTAPYGNGHYILEPDLACAPCPYQRMCACPACAQAIEVRDVAEILTTDCEQDPVVSHAERARVYRTEVLTSGAFRLQPLNSPRTGVSGDVIEDHRRFWDTLLSDGTKTATVDLPTGALEEDPGAYERMQEICWNGRNALLRLQRAQRTTPRADLLKLIEEQTNWQHLLRNKLDHSSQLKPLVQFVLVLLAVARTRSLENYIEDVHYALSYLEKGLTLLKPQVAIREKVPVHA
jgi:ADP-heptose:LPS heptosyltransferase